MARKVYSWGRCFVPDFLSVFSQPPILMWLSHKLSLLCIVTYLCITVVANCIIQKRSYVQGMFCMTDLPFQLCIRSNSNSCYRYLNQRSFLWEFLRILFCSLGFYISDMQDGIAEKRLLSVWMIYSPFKLNLLYWQLFCGWFKECLFCILCIRNNKTL